MNRVFSTLALIGTVGLATQADALIAKGDVTANLGPNFFQDEAATGGSDVQIQEGTTSLAREDFSTNGPLNVGAGGTLIEITGIGWASPNFAGTDATSVTLNIRYLGADGVGGGGDDVLIGTVTDAYPLPFEGAGEYYWLFDSPISNTIDGLNSFFRFEFNVANDTGDGTLRMKRLDNGNLKLTAAGTSTAVTGGIPGDTDGDGDIDDSDLGTAFSNYTGPLSPGTGGKTAADGDTDGDGDVDDSDLGTAFSGYTGPLSPAAVPEPTSLALIGLGGLLALRRRRA
ncbi:MAG: PEP-CTERM sorting domain-containing protein [Phycisphaeraceae bacterium]